MVNIKKQQSFFNIHPSDISITPEDYEYDHGQKIPKTFDLKITNKNLQNNIKINADIHMKTIETQYMRFFTIQYWRYHVTANGHITLGSIKENIDEKPQIIEYLSFKS